jgi:hypothetical protein
MKHIKKFNESLPNKSSIDQLNKVRKISKGIDIGDKISDMNKQGANISYIHNPIDTGIESYEDFEKKNKKFNSSWNIKGSKIYEKIKNYESFIKESINNYEYGCAMIYLNKDVTKQLISEIDENDLYNDNSGNYGLELKPHVTCLYGIHDGGKYDYLSDSDKEDIFHICRNISGDIKLHNVSLFINDNFEVLKFDVENDSLFKINKKLSDSFKNSNYYPDYHPHVTISYLKPGTGEKYVKLFKELKLNVKPESIVYSSPDRKDEKQNL